MNKIRQGLDRILDVFSITEKQRADLQYYIETCGGKCCRKPYNFIEYIEDYLFEVKYIQDNIDYDWANKYFKTNYKSIRDGACSSIVSGNYLFRNFDWNYSNDSCFVVITNRSKDRFKSIGIASNTKLYNDFVNSGEYSDKYKLLPFKMMDGINENGVAVSINVVPDDFGHTNQNHPLRENICTAMLNRYILDHATSAQQICEYIKNNLNVYSPEGHEYHYLVADKDNTYLIEFIYNETVITKLTDNKFITNFHRKNVQITEGELDWSTISNYGMGVERFEYLLNNYPFNDLTSIKQCLSDLKYTKSYTELVNPWLTEFVGKYGELDLKAIDAKNNPSKFTPILNAARELYSTRDRNTELTWQTVHSSIYDLVNKKLYIGVQEKPIVYSFELNNDYTIL